jgi:hypothetical protein
VDQFPREMCPKTPKDHLGPSVDHLKVFLLRKIALRLLKLTSEDLERTQGRDWLE